MKDEENLYVRIYPMNKSGDQIELFRSPMYGWKESEGEVFLQTDKERVLPKERLLGQRRKKRKTVSLELPSLGEKETLNKIVGFEEHPINILAQERIYLDGAEVIRLELYYSEQVNGKE